MAKPKSKLAQLRRINFFSQREVAEYLGMTQMSYSKIERGERGLSLENAKKLKALFKTSCIDDLLDNSESEAS